MGSVYSHDCVLSIGSRASSFFGGGVQMKMSSYLNFLFSVMISNCYIVKYIIRYNYYRHGWYNIRCACTGNMPCSFRRQDKWASPLAANVSWQVQAESVMGPPSWSQRPVCSPQAPEQLTPPCLCTSSTRLRHSFISTKPIFTKRVITVNVTTTTG